LTCNKHGQLVTCVSANAIMKIPENSPSTLVAALLGSAEDVVDAPTSTATAGLPLIDDTPPSLRLMLSSLDTTAAPVECDASLPSDAAVAAAAAAVMNCPSATQSSADPPPTITDAGYTVHTRGYLQVATCMRA
jgi:hypothetical protein